MSSSIWLDAVCIVCIKSKEEAGLGKNLEAFYMFDCWNVVSYVIFKESEILIKYVDDFCCFQIYLQHVGVFLQVKLFRMLWGVHIMLPRKYCWNRMARRQMFGALELYSTFCLVGFPLSGQVLTTLPNLFLFRVVLNLFDSLGSLGTEILCLF